MDLTDEQLVSRAQEGDRPAFEELVNRHQEKAYNLALQMSYGQVQEAQDLTQEAFVRAFRNLKHFRGDSAFYTWFFRIVVNTCLDGRRRRRRWDRVFSFWRPQEEDEGRDELETFPDPSADSSPLEMLSGKQLSREIRKAVAALPERQRLAFRLKVLQGMSLKEIAQVMALAHPWGDIAGSDGTGNPDNDIDYGDMIAMQGNWLDSIGDNEDYPMADLNHDRIVDLIDFAIMANSY